MKGHFPNLKISLAIPEIQAIKFSKKFLLIFFFFLFSSSFHTLCVNRYNSCMHASIWLKLCTPIEGLKANTFIKFEINPINIQIVISNFTHKPKSNFCQAYKLNRLEEQAEKSVCSWVKVTPNKFPISRPPLASVFLSAIKFPLFLILSLFSLNTSKAHKSILNKCQFICLNQCSCAFKIQFSNLKNGYKRRKYDFYGDSKVDIAF